MLQALEISRQIISRKINCVLLGNGSLRGEKLEGSPKMQAFIWWSIYVRAANLGKVKAEHLPPIEDALEGAEFPWEIMRDDGEAGLFRLVNYQNLHGARVEDLIIPTLRRAYRLASPWSITGLGDLGAGRLRHVMGSCTKPAISPRPPALFSLAFEIQPGRMIGTTATGGWTALRAGDLVRFSGDMAPILANLPAEEVHAIREGMARQPFQVTELMADGSVEIELGPFEDETHFFYVNAADLQPTE